MRLQTKKRVKVRRMRGLFLLFCMVVLAIGTMLIEQKLQLNERKTDAFAQVSGRSLYQTVMDYYLPMIHADGYRQRDLSKGLYDAVVKQFPVLSSAGTNDFPDVYGENWEESVSQMEQENEFYVEQSRTTQTEMIEPDVTMDFSSDAIVAQESRNGQLSMQTDKKKGSLDLQELSDVSVLLAKHYRVDSTTEVRPEQIDLDNLKEIDLSLKKNVSGPQILIYHTHAQEGYKDSTPGDLSESVVGVGDYLAKILQTEYGLSVIHDRASYDKNHRDYAYSYAGPALEKLLKKYPSIEVVIDLHRDGVADTTRLLTTVDDTQMAPVMFFNGLSYTKTRGKITSLPNPNLKTNLAFSQRMELLASEYYPGFTRQIYLKGLRYNLHYCPKSLLVEVGAQTNTLEEAMNAMPVLADLLNRTLQGEKP